MKMELGEPCSTGNTKVIKFDRETVNRCEPIQTIEPVTAALHNAPLQEAGPQAKIISFPVYQPPAIDWDEIGALAQKTLS
jgi:hypothetical protein